MVFDKCVRGHKYTGLNSEESVGDESGTSEILLTTKRLLAIYNCILILFCLECIFRIDRPSPSEPNKFYVHPPPRSEGSSQSIKNIFY